MSVSKDTTKGTWTVYARYTDWQGKVKVLHKRGFKTKREAVEYEREYLLKKSKDVTMGFEQFVECYLEDLKPRLKYNTCTGPAVVLFLNLQGSATPFEPTARVSLSAHWSTQIGRLELQNVHRKFFHLIHPIS